MQSISECMFIWQIAKMVKGTVPSLYDVAM